MLEFNWRKYISIFICGTIAVFPLISAAQKNEAAKESENTKIYFSADEVEENSETGVITAKGDVNIIRNNVSLKADLITYDRINDIITATGNVSVTDPSGAVIFASSGQLTDKMSRGALNDVKTILADESRLAAQRIKQSANKNKHFFYSVYSPCDVCAANPTPLWQIKARKISHDTANKDVYYQHAFLEIKDIPVFYTPFMSHPDPTVKRRSGFLPPSLKSNSYLGSSVELRYFWNISEHEDILFTPILSAEQDLVLAGNYRKIMNNGEINFSGSYLKDKDSKDSRYNIFLKSRYEINDLWLAKFDINYASDGAYLKDLSLQGRTDTWLTSKASLERFDVRDYATIELYSYKLVSHSLREQNSTEYKRREYGKPYVLPYMFYEHIGDSNQYGGYFKTSLSTASIYREHKETQTSQRISMINSWNLPYTSPYGEKYKLSASVKSDLYYIDSYTNQNNDDYTGSVGRIFPQLGIEWRLPLVKATEDSRQIIEPIIVAVAAPNSGNKNNKIPNEDSLNAQLDDTNILNLDRYDGYDRNDTGSRISYGLNWSSYGNIIGRTSAFIAQSYYFNDNESFSKSLGEESHLSDVVGRVYAAPNRYLDFNYRFRIDKDNFNFKYNEISSRIGADIASLYISFISIKDRKSNNSDSGLYFFDDYNERKELYTSLNVKLSQDWRFSLYNRQDLRHKGRGSLEHGGKIIYEDECFSLVFDIHKYNSTDPDYDDGYEYSATFLLKTLGGIGSK